MASLPTRNTASFDAIKPVSSLVLLDDELNDMKGATGFLNGGTTGKKLLVKTSDGTDPPVDQDQIGAGLLARWKQNGTLKASITNAGQITTAIATGTSPLSVVSTTVVTNLNADKVDGFDLVGNKTAWAYGWFIDDPSVFTTQDDTLLPVFIVPAGNTIASTVVKVTFYGGSHTTGGSLDFRPVFTAAAGGAGSELGTVLLDNTNNTARVTYSATCATSLATGDKISLKLAGRSGTITERKVSVSVHGTQLFTT